VRSFWTFLTSAGLVTLAIFTLAARGSGSARKCEEAVTAAATSVEGVDGAEFTCKRSFGNPR
jgi:hypothetical protein